MSPRWYSASVYIYLSDCAAALQPAYFDFEYESDFASTMSLFYSNRYRLQSKEEGKKAVYGLLYDF